MRRVLLLAFLVLLASSSWAQFRAGLTAKPVKLRVFVTDSDHNVVLDTTVELMDAVGSSSALDKKLTNPDGMVEFTTLAGSHRIRVYGPDIQEYSGQFEITPSETSHVERITVKLKSAGTSSTPGEMVSAARLKVPSKARKQYEKGNKLSAEKRWKEAAIQYQSAVAMYPQFDVAYNALGVSCMNLDDVAGARQAFQNAIRVNPGLAPALRNLARLALRANDYAQADQLLKKSLASEPINPWALVSAAYAELQLNALDEAVANARRVHLLPHQGFEDAHIIAALALERKGQTPQALAEYEMYLSEAPTGLSAAMARMAVARLSARSSH